MREAKISDFKNRLGRYLDLVRKGETIRILDRDRPLAHIVPIGEPTRGHPVGTEALAEMERKGLIRRGAERVDPQILGKDPPGKPCGVLEALLEERAAR